MVTVRALGVSYGDVFAGPAPDVVTQGEKDLMRVIDASFRHSEPLQRHVEFLYDVGAAYLAVNDNLLFHGCVPLTENGEFDGPEVDGGISKAYHSKTGIAGYPLIYNSHHLALAAHREYGKIESDLGSYTPDVTVTEEMPRRVLIADTDEGAVLREKIADLEALLAAYGSGTLRVQRTR